MNALCRTTLITLLSFSAFAAEEMPFDKQLMDLGYCIYRTSATNLIQGLNLDAQQLAKLREMTARIEGSSPKPPPCNGRMSGSLEPVRAMYLDVAQSLLKDGSVPASVEARVGPARMAEANEIRASLHRNRGKSGCQACHTAPSERGPSYQPEDHSVFNPTTVFLGHLTGLYGISGSWNLAGCGPEIEKVLNESQLALTSDFSCCITPPQDLKDPTRVGQAAVNAKTLDGLKLARQCPEWAWPVARGAIVKHAEQILIAISPGMPNAQRATEAEKAGQVFDKARALGDVEYEMQKESLAKELGPQTATKSDDHKGFRAAMFLLLPGNLAIYDRQIERLRNAPAQTAAKTDLKTIRGADHCENGQCALKDGGNIPLKPAAGK